MSKVTLSESFYQNIFYVPQSNFTWVKQGSYKVDIEQPRVTIALAELPGVA